MKNNETKKNIVDGLKAIAGLKNQLCSVDSLDYSLFEFQCPAAYVDVDVEKEQIIISGLHEFDSASWYNRLIINCKDFDEEYLVDEIMVDNNRIVIEFTRSIAPIQIQKNQFIEI